MLVSESMKESGLSAGTIERIVTLEMLTREELDKRADGVILGYSRKQITKKECQMFLDIVNLINDSRVPV